MDLPPDGEIRVVPLGGLGQIGMNCLAIEHRSGILVIDCGITFPHQDLGIDTFHPDLTYLEQRRDRVAGVFLTHGHEDHVGALPYLIDRMDVPVFGPSHALAVAKHRLAERDLAGKARLFATKVRERYRVGPFEVEPIRVAHSIVDATALAVRTAAGTVLHTGDFKFDPNPPDGEPTDEARLEELGDEGVRLLLSDSTNIDGRSLSGSEADVGEVLEAIVASAEGRVVIGMFASNVQRLKLIGEVAVRARRNIVLLGRSVQLHVQWGHELGWLAWPSDLVLGQEHALGLSRQRLLVIAGGTQAEPRSALSRLAARSHPALTLTPGDTVVLSSRIIPGNDRAVFDLMADLLRQGLLVRSWITDPDVHVSGHAHRKEQERMLDLVRPRAFIPIHGTLHHLVRHAELARSRGVSDVLVIENGQTARLDAGPLARGECFEAEPVATWAGREIPKEVLRERTALGRAGTVHVTVVVDHDGRLQSPPILASRGVIGAEDQPSVFRAAARAISEAMAARPWRSGAPDDETVAEVARIAVRRALEAETGSRPIALVTVVRSTAS